MDKSDKVLVNVVGGLALVLGGVLLGHHDFTEKDNLKIYERENKPRIVRIYQEEHSDRIFVEDTIPNQYITLDAYLDRIPDKRNKEIEKLNIEKIVDWDK